MNMWGFRGRRAGSYRQTLLQQDCALHRTFDGFHWLHHYTRFMPEADVAREKRRLDRRLLLHTQKVFWRSSKQWKSRRRAQIGQELDRVYETMRDSRIDHIREWVEKSAAWYAEHGELGVAQELGLNYNPEVVQFYDLSSLVRPGMEGDMPKEKTRHELLVEAGWTYDAGQNRYSPPEKRQTGTERWFDEAAAWTFYQSGLIPAADTTAPTQQRQGPLTDPRKQQPE